VPPAPGQPVYGQPAPGQPYGQPVYGQPYPPAYAAGPRTNTLALVSMILSLVGLATGVTAIGGIVCGHIGLSQIKRTGEAGRGMALAGVIVGYVVVGFWVLLIVAYIVILVVVFGIAASAGAFSTT
jgi:hypothetical protein